MEEKKTMGSALLDVFDAGVVLVKSEINGVTRKVTEMAKAKGVGAVLLLGAVGPLLMGLIFLILALFYLLSLWLPAWGAALVIALLSLAIAGGLAFMGIQKLGAEVDTTPPKRPVDLSELPVNTVSAGAAATGTAYVKDLQVTPTPTAHTAVPVYESKPGGEAPLYGSGLNERIEQAKAQGSQDHHGHGHHADPNLQNPVVVHNAPGISVSTTPTFREDMKDGN